MLYQFVRRLSTPFKDWKMYKMGVIDENGNFIVPKKERTPEQLSSYSYFDILILNLKKLIAQVPGGKTRIATLAAALLLLREGKPLSESAVVDRFLEFKENIDYYMELIENEGAAGGVPANNMSGGEVAQKDNPMNIKKILRRKHKLGKKGCGCDT